MSIDYAIIAEQRANYISPIGWCWLYFDKSSIGDSNYDFVGKLCNCQESEMLNKLYPRDKE